MITAIAVKEHESSQVIHGLKTSFSDSEINVWTCAVVHSRYDGKLARCVRDIMKSLQEPGSSISILAFSHLWLYPNDERNDKASADAPEVDSEDDSDTESNAGLALSGGLNSSSVGLLYALCHWYASQELSQNRLYLIFERGVPKALHKIPNLILDDSFIVSSQPSVIIEAHSKLPPPLLDKLVVVGVIGARGKTSTLRSFANPKSVWMYCHEIVHCELGESPRIVRGLFQTASGRQTPSLVLMDDADLILSTSGRIMREITEEICTCVSSDFSRGYFVYSALSRKGVPDVLLANTNQFIDLD